MIKPVAMRTVHRHQMPDDDDIQQTIHDCLGSLAFMPNEPTN